MSRVSLARNGSQFGSIDAFHLWIAWSGWPVLINESCLTMAKRPIIALRAGFKWLSKVITYLRLLRLMVGLKDSRQFFRQWEAKAKPIAPCTRDFSRASSELQVIARNWDWFIALFFAVVIGRSNCNWFRFFDSHLKTALWHNLVPCISQHVSTINLRMFLTSSLIYWLLASITSISSFWTATRPGISDHGGQLIFQDTWVLEPAGTKQDVHSRLCNSNHHTKNPEMEQKYKNNKIKNCLARRVAKLKLAP